MKKAVFAVVVLCLFLLGSNAFALTAGQSYTVSLSKFNNDGTTTDLGISSSAVTADANGIINFTLSSVPDNTVCSFMLITIKDSLGATVKESVVPCAKPGTTMPLGVSDITYKQTNALKSAFQAAGSSDPILAVFGFTIVRTTGITAAELAVIAGIANQGINGAGGFVDHLKTARGVTDAQMVLYRKSVIEQLADPDAGYTKLIKASVNETVRANEASKRGEGAAILLSILVKAATDAGFPQDYIMESFNAMGSVVMPRFRAAVGAGTLSATTVQGIDSSVGGGIDKLKAHRVVEKYSASLGALGGNAADITQFRNAANTMATNMNAAFSEFEQAAFATGQENAAAIDAAQTVLQTKMQTNFSTFITQMAVSDSRIINMIDGTSGICAALHSVNPAIPATGCIGTGMFKFYKPDGTPSNWPVNMVVLTDWGSAIKKAGGDLIYTRDNADMTALANMMPWMGSCSKPGPGVFNKSTCEDPTRIGGAGVWTAGRRCYGTVAQAGEVGACQLMPTPYASMFAIQEDIQIRQFVREKSRQTAGDDMGKQEDAEVAFTNGLRRDLIQNISGTTNTISDDQKRAVVTLMQPPQM